MNLLRQKKQQSHSRIRKEHLTNYFKERRLQIGRISSQIINQEDVSHKQFLQKMLDKSLLQGQILRDVRQHGLLQFLKQESQRIVNNGQENSNNLITKKYILALCSNIFKEKIAIDQKEAMLFITLPIIESFFKNKLLYKKESIFKVMGTQIFSFYMNSIMSNYFCFDQQEQLKLEYFIHRLLFELLHECFNPQPKIVYQDIRYCLINFLSFHQQDDNFNKQKLNRNIGFIMQIILMQNQHIIQNSQKAIQLQLPLHICLFYFYKRISYHFNQIVAIFNCSQEIQTLLKLIMFGLRCLNNSQTIQNCIICLYNMLRFQLVDEDQVEQLLKSNKSFQFMLQYIETTMKSQVGLLLIQQLVSGYLERKKFKKLIQQYYQYIIDVCRVKLQLFQDLQALKASLKIICLLFAAGAQNLTVQINLFLIYFNSLNGKMLLEEIQQHFSQTDEEIKELIQIINYNSVEIESSETILQKYKIGFLDFSH